MNEHDIDLEIASLRDKAAELKQRHALPYISGFKKRYLWDNDEAEALYNSYMDRIGNLQIQKKNLNIVNRK